MGRTCAILDRVMLKLVDYAGYGAFGVALMATLSSLAASELFHMPPCELCWYQRVFMYPIAIVIGIAIVRRDTSWPLTTMILAGIGWLISLYHSLLQWGIIPSTLAPCTGGVSCATPEMDPILGFITIPFMSFMAFSAIIICAVLYWKGAKNEQRV